MITNASPGQPKLDIEGEEEVTRSTFGTLYNTYIFLPYAMWTDSVSVSLCPVHRRPEIDRGYLLLIPCAGVT
jgi:hypothetical protein